MSAASMVSTQPAAPGPAVPARALDGLRRVLLAAAAAACLALTGCASLAPVEGQEGGRTAQVDPFESFNRAMHGFNDGLDRAVLKPVATGYQNVVPAPARQMVGSFFGNLADVWTAVNQLLQGKPVDAFYDLFRVAINTTFGFGGIIDVASDLGIEKHSEDFGQTLAVWGVPSGPYLVLPFFGPSTVRDAPGRAVDVVGDPLNQLDSHGQRNNLWALRVVDDRARLFRAERLMRGAALDEYSFIRDAWLQRRRSLIHDGNPPVDYDDEVPDYGEEPDYDDEE